MAPLGICRRLHAREGMALEFLKTMKIYRIIQPQTNKTPPGCKCRSYGAMLRNGKVSRAIGRYIGSWKYDKS